MTELRFIETFLRDNAAYARDKFAAREMLTVTSKSDATDLLTEVDLTLQKRIVDQIRDRYPDDGIYAEEGEFAQRPKNPRGRCWVIDPIDGTNNFVRGIFPIFAISIAFTMNGRATLAGVGFPGLGTDIIAERGAGAVCNGRRLRVSDVKVLAEARMDMDFSNLRDRAEMMQRAGTIINRIGQVRCHGSAVASICQVGTGDVDAYLHMSLHPWDYAAAQLIVEESGGRATRLDGSPLEVFDGGRGVLITNGILHEPIRSLLSPAAG